jgi:hypothetical protein
MATLDFRHSGSQEGVDRNGLFHYFPYNSSEREGTDNRMKPEKTRLGKLEMQLLAYAQLRETDVLTSGQVAAVLEITPQQEWKLFNRMAASGLIIRLKRGVYLVPS